jgi:hypothetical protein
VGVASPRPPAIPALLTADGERDLGAHQRARRPGWVAGVGCLDRESQIEAVEQGLGEATAIPLPLRFAAPAVPSRHAARTGVAAGDEQHVGRKLGRGAVAAHAHHSLLEWLTEGLERRRTELGQLVEEEDAAMCDDRKTVTF